MPPDITIKTFDGAFRAYVAMPVATPAPVVLVIQEIFGVNAGIRKIADELAGQGFFAVCPDLFWRFEPGLQLSDHDEADCQRAFALYDRYDFGSGVRDLAATIAVCRQLPGANGNVGVMGFCLGGLMAYLTAARTDVDAAVEYYGAETERFLSEGNQIAKPLLMHLAAEDEFMDHATQAAIRAGLSANRNVTIHTYPGCEHAFARPHGAHFNAAAATTANARTLEFFRKHL